MKTLSVLMLLVLMGGCTSPYYQATKSFETGIIEPNVDAAVDETIARFCNFPSDIVARTVNRKGMPMYDALVNMCPATYGYFEGLALKRNRPVTP